MIEEEYEDFKLQSKSYSQLPQQIMMKKWDECGRDVFKFWNSIEWDSSWLRHDTEEEKKLKEIERNFNSHPFKKWIEKESIVY